MRYDPKTDAVLDSVDLGSWEFWVDGRTIRLTYEPDGAFKRLVRLPGARDELTAAAVEWASQEIRRQLAGQDCEVQFVEDPSR